MQPPKDANLFYMAQERECRFGGVKRGAEGLPALAAEGLPALAVR